MNDHDGCPSLYRYCGLPRDAALDDGEGVSLDSVKHPVIGVVPLWELAP